VTDGSTITRDAAVNVNQMWSRRYQWLPAEFLVDDEGKVKIESYINSIPFQSGLYPIISEIFERSAPLFSKVLTDVRNHFHRTRFYTPWGYKWWDTDGRHRPPAELYEGMTLAVPKLTSGTIIASLFLSLFLSLNPRCSNVRRIALLI
jgi:hypothetical protein